MKKGLIDWIIIFRLLFIVAVLLLIGFFILRNRQDISAALKPPPLSTHAKLNV